MVAHCVQTVNREVSAGGSGTVLRKESRCHQGTAVSRKCCPGQDMKASFSLKELCGKELLILPSFSLTNVFAFRLPELLCLSIFPSLPICLHTRMPASELGEGKRSSTWQDSGICALQVLQNLLTQTSWQMREK